MKKIVVSELRGIKDGDLTEKAINYGTEIMKDVMSQIETVDDAQNTHNFLLVVAGHITGLTVCSEVYNTMDPAKRNNKSLLIEEMRARISELAVVASESAEHKLTTMLGNPSAVFQASRKLKD